MESRQMAFCSVASPPTRLRADTSATASSKGAIAADSCPCARRSARMHPQLALQCYCRACMQPTSQAACMQTVKIELCLRVCEADPELSLIPS